MLSLLRIRDLAIIEELELEFTAGMNVITGETGAGKSLLLKGLGFLLGGKFGAEIIRHEAARCEVEGVFELPPQVSGSLPSALQENGGELIVRRAVERSGRSKTYLAGHLASKGELEAIAPLLVDIIGQHQQGTLLDERCHREVLDRFGVDPKLRAQVREAYETYSSCHRRLREFQMRAAEDADYFRRLAFERDELEKLDLRAGERAELQQELTRLASVEVLGGVVGEAEALYEDAGHGLERQLHRLRSLLEQGAKVESEFHSPLGILASAVAELGEIRLFLGEYGSRVEADPARLESLRERIAEIAHAERKYGKTEVELVAYREAISGELAAFESGAFDEKELRRQFEVVERELRAVERSLTQARHDAAARLSVAVERELRNVELKRARFAIEVLPTESTAMGADAVRFLLAANPGQPHRPLAAVASGGELSRILLILKSVLNDNGGPPVQVFDEIDVGIGGAVAQAVGERIKQIAREKQVILITHAPQIAALADHHLRVEKTVEGDTTTVTLHSLSLNERRLEVARMLAGRKVSEHFEASARELLRAGRKRRKEESS